MESVVHLVFAGAGWVRLKVILVANMLNVSIKANADCIELSVTFFIFHSSHLFFSFPFSTPTHILELPLEAYSEHHSVCLFTSHCCVCVHLDELKAEHKFREWVTT